MTLPNISPIPDWDASGILPASYGGDPTSPYEASLLDVVARFGNTNERKQLLMGLLNFRAELHNAGLVKGFQWIDGSFVENIEEIENRPPKDIDVVTFFHIPDKYTQETLARQFPNVFNHREVKDTLKIDSYFVSLNQVTPERLISRSMYWNSLWSHNRDNLWKGYLQVDLASLEDAEARTELERLETWVDSHERT